MNDGDALLAAVIQFPAEDTPRLVYADWLRENGQETRADFIQIQIEIEQMGDVGECPKCHVPLDPLRKDNLPLLAACRKCQTECGFWNDHGPGWRKKLELFNQENDLWNKARTSGDVFRWFPGGTDLYVSTSLKFRRPTVWLCHDDPGHNRANSLLSRGFLDHLRIAADDFLWRADELIWNPKMRDVCRACRGYKCYRVATEEEKKYHGSYIEAPCDRCEGKGVPRPIPPTAQPIRQVTITALPALSNEAMNRLALKHRYDWLPTESDPERQPMAWEFLLRIFAAEWPEIVFNSGNNIVP